MNREDLRPVEFTVIEKTKAKKGKKIEKTEVKKQGYFHLWGTNVNGKGNEKFFALIEDAQTGRLVEIDFKDVRFLSEAELSERFQQIIAEANAEVEAMLAAETPVAEEAPAAETPAAVEAAAEPKAKAPAKPRAPRKAKS
jgi:hypothetical protein